MQTVDLGERGIHQFPDDATPEEIQSALIGLDMDAAAQESARQQSASNAAGIGETAARSLDFIGAAGRVLKGIGKAGGALVRDIGHGDLGPTFNKPFLPRLLAGPDAEVGPPPEGPVEKGVTQVAETLPVIAGGMALERLGVPAPLAFGTLMGSEAAAEGGGPVDIIHAGVVGAAIPETGAFGRELAANLLNKAVNKGLLSANATVVQKAAETLFAQGGMQLFMNVLDMPNWAMLPADKRKEYLKEKLIENSAWLLMDLPGFIPGRPSHTQQEMEPMTRAASALNEIIDSPKTLDALDKLAYDYVQRQPHWRRQGSFAGGGEKEMVMTGQEVLEPHLPPTFYLTNRKRQIPPGGAAAAPEPEPVEPIRPPGFIPVEAAQLPVEPKGPENAVQIGVPAPLPVGQTPQAGAQVVGEVRKPEEPAEARPAEEGAPKVEPAAPVGPIKPTDLVPAFKDKEGNILVGQPGQTHNDILSARTKLDDGTWLEKNMGIWQDGRGFQLKGQGWISRKEAADLLGEKEPLQSERLAELQKPPAPAAPEKPAEPAPEDKAKSILDQLRKRMVPAEKPPEAPKPPEAAPTPAPNRRSAEQQLNEGNTSIVVADLPDSELIALAEAHGLPIPERMDNEAERNALVARLQDIERRGILARDAIARPSNIPLNDFGAKPGSVGWANMSYNRFQDILEEGKWDNGDPLTDNDRARIQKRIEDAKQVMRAAFEKGIQRQEKRQTAEMPMFPELRKKDVRTFDELLQALDNQRRGDKNREQTTREKGDVLAQMAQEESTPEQFAEWKKYSDESEYNKRDASYYTGYWHNILRDKVRKLPITVFSNNLIDAEASARARGEPKKASYEVEALMLGVPGLSREQAVKIASMSEEEARTALPEAKKAADRLIIQGKNRKKKAMEIGGEISKLNERLNLLKSDLTEGQGEVVLRTPIAENPSTGEMESKEYRLRQMTSQEFMDYFKDPMQRMRDFGTVYTPWRAEMRRVYYDENGKETRHDAWYIDAIQKTREEAIEKAASYSGGSAEGWKQIRDTLNKPKGPEIFPQEPLAPIGAGKEGVSKGAGAMEAPPVSGLTAEESARLQELTAKADANERMTKAERDRFIKLQEKAGARGGDQRPEVRSGENEPPSLSLDTEPPKGNVAFREPANPGLHRAAIETARTRLAAMFGKEILPENFREVVPDLSQGGMESGKALSSDSWDSLQRILGQQVVFLDLEGSGLAFHGATIPELPGYVFINARTPRPYLAVFGHEFGHNLRQQNPELYREMVTKLGPLVQNFRGFWSDLIGTYGKRGLKLPPMEKAGEELTSNLIGDSFIDPKFWDVLAAKEPTLFRKLSTAVLEFLRQTWDKLKSFGAYEYFTDIKAAHETVADALRKFSKEQGTDAKELSDPSLSIDPPTPEGERPGGPKMGVTQVASEKIGVERPMEFIAGIRQRIQTGYFDGTQPVEPGRSENAWEIAQRMVNPETKGAFASELQRNGGGEMAPGLLRNELWDYAVRQAVRGDTNLMQFMVRQSQNFQTLAGEALADGDTALGRGLRAARNRAFGGMWSRLISFRNEQLAATGRRLQQGEAGLRQIIDAIDGLVANIGDIDAFERGLRTPEIQRIIDRTSEAGQGADEVVANAPFVPPERRATILETVYQWMAREVDPQADRAPFIDTLKAELERLRLTPDQAQTIADATWNRKLTVDGAVRRRLWNQELRRLDNLAEKTADAFILSVDQAEWKRPEQPNEVRDIIKEALKSEAPLDANNLLGFKRDLTQRLITAGLSEGKARDLANAITQRRETDLLNAQLRVRDRAVNSKGLRSLGESLKASPYLAQNDPQWRFDTAVRWFESNGVPREQAQEAAKMFDAEFVAALTRAAEQAAKRLITKGDYGRNIPELIEAVRLGLTDPSKNWSDEIAQREGFRPLTPESQQRLAELEQKYANPNLSAHEQVALVEQMMGIVRHAGDGKGRVMNIMGESFAASLLSGIRTMTLNWMQPWFTMLATGASHAAFEPRDFPTVVRSMWNASKNWWPEYKYAWSKDAYELSSEEQVFHSNALKTAFEDAQTDWAKGKYSSAILKFTYGWQQYVIRGLQAADQAGMVVAREWKMALYGSIAMREAGLKTSQITELVDVAEGFKRAEYERALYEGKSHNEAQVIANESTIDALTNFFENKLGSRQKAEAVKEAALYDAFNIVGRRAPGVEESDEGFLSRYSGLNRIMRFVSETRREGGGASMLTIMAVGFMNVPLRTARFYAGFGPYGILRWGIDKYRTNRGYTENFWKQSFKNEYQSKARLREALVGTTLMLAFLGWQHRHHTSDEDAEKKAFAMYVTGNGPSNKTMRDAWLKRGFEPYTLHVIADGKIRSKLPVNRVGQILAFPLGLAASLDDLAWRRKQEQATSPGKKEFAGREIVAAMGTYYNIVGAQGVLQAFSHLSQMGQGQAGTGRAVGVSLASTGSAVLIPGKSLIQGVTDMITGPVDRSSVEAAMMANVPVLNALWNGQAINRFGDPIGDRTWSAKLTKLGFPVLFRVADTPENKALYQMILDKGAPPPDLRRYIVEDKYGPLSQEDWQKFVKISGSALKSEVLANLASLNGTDAHGVKLFMNRAAGIANDQAAQALHLTPKPTFSASSGGSEGSGGGAVPTLPKSDAGLASATRISLPGGGSVGRLTRSGGSRVSSAGIGSGATGIPRAATVRLSLSGFTGGRQRFVRGRLRAHSTRLRGARRRTRLSVPRRSFRRRRISLRA